MASQQERDRRFRALRAMMEEQGLDALILGGNAEATQRGYIRYTADWRLWGGKGFVVFPREGEPTLVLGAGSQSYWSQVTGWIPDVRAAGDIGLFKIVSEAGIAAGVRRIEALTGCGALDFVRQMEDEQREIAALLKSEAGSSRDRLEKMLARQRDLQREIDTLQAKLNAAASGDLLSHATAIPGGRLLAVQVQVQDIKALRDLSDTLKERIGAGVIVLGTVIEGKANLLVAVTKGLSATLKAGDIIRKIAPIIGGSGGGKPELAQAGGNQPERLDEALQAVSAIVMAG